MKNQLTFEKLEAPSKYFGGSLLKGKRKGLRPLSTKHALHLVLRSSRAKGSRSFIKHKPKIKEYIDRESIKFGVKIYRISYCGNHLHLLGRIISRREYKRFIRSITSIIAGIVTNTLGKSGAKGFWDARPFTRIVGFGREFQYVANYVLKNTLEALGLIPYVRSEEQLKRYERKRFAFEKKKFSSA